MLRHKISRRGNLGERTGTVEQLSDQCVNHCIQWEQSRENL